jgi:hypothetical protein
VSRKVEEWIGKTPDTPAPPRVRRKSRGAPYTTEFFLDRSIPEPNSGCWFWMNATAPNGYGVVNVGRRTTRAHRLSYEVAHGVRLPSSIDVCHTCDIRCCVNPDHLFKGTRADNMRDCAEKGRIRIPGLAGEDLPQSVLTERQVLEIRASRKSQRALARDYGVDKGTIAHIVHRKTWKHI